MFKSIARFSVRFRWPIIIVWLVAVPLAIKFLPSLTSVTNNDNSAFLPAHSPSTVATDLIAPFEGSKTTVTSTIVVSNSAGALTAADDAVIATVETKIKTIAGVSFVRDGTISKDGQAREIIVGTSSSGYGSNAPSIVASIRNDFPSSVAPLSFHLTGTLASSVDANNSQNDTRNKAQNFTVLLILVLLFIVYRSFLAPFITLIPAALSLALAGPVIAESTKWGVQVSSITQLLLIILLLGAGTDYGLFLVFRVREERRRGLETKEAVVQALAKVGEAITFSAATVVAALLSLLLASFGFYKGLGPSLAIGIGILLLSGLTLLPALLTVFGRAVFWPTHVKKATAKTPFWGVVAERVIKRPVVTLIVGLALFAVLMTGLIGYKTSGFDNSTPATNTDSGQGAQVITDHFPAASNNPQSVLIKFKQPVWDNLATVATAQQGLAAAPVFKDISGPLNPGGVTLTADQIATLYRQLGDPSTLPPTPPNAKVPAGMYQLYRSLAQFISPDGRTVQFYGVLSAGKSGSSAASQAMPAVRTSVSTVAESIGADQSGVLSQDAVIYDISHVANSDLKKIIPIVLLIIAVLLAVMLRSLIAPWYLIATVGLSYLATLGFAMIVFVHHGDGSGLNFFLPFLLFVFAMALGEDYNILVMSRIREEAQSSPSLSEAITKAIDVTGSTVTSAGVILAGTFIVLGFSGGSGNSQVQQIGFSIAFGILLDTFFVRTLLVPSIAVLLGRWNWWPSKLSRQPKA